jgi:hypothetical protein
VPTVERIVRAGCPVPEIWARLCDYEAAPRWDPRLEAVQRVQGEGDLGTVYRTRSSLAGVAADGVLRVTGYRRHELLQLRGAHAKLRATETLKVLRGRHGTFVHWVSELEAPPDVADVSEHVLEHIGETLVERLAAYLRE